MLALFRLILFGGCLELPRVAVRSFQGWVVSFVVSGFDDHGMERDKHSDILSHEPCDVCKECVRQRKTTKTNNYTHIHVFTKCVTSLPGFMCFVLILVFTLSLVSDVSPFSGKVLYVNFISPRTRNSKHKVLFFWMLQSDVVLSSSTQSVSQILAYFTSRNRVF